MTHLDIRFWKDRDAIPLTLDSPSIDKDNIDFTKFDLVYMAGGWGAAWDLGESLPLATGITEAAAAGKVLGSVCHGALGFIQAKVKPGTPDGHDLVKGLNMSAVSNRQIEQLGIANITPMHPETELRSRGANYFANHGLLTDIDQSRVEVDGMLVTGQNQNSACETAQRMLDRLPAVQDTGRSSGDKCHKDSDCPPSGLCKVVCAYVPQEGHKDCVCA